MKKEFKGIIKRLDMDNRYDAKPFVTMELQILDMSPITFKEILEKKCKIIIEND